MPQSERDAEFWQAPRKCHLLMIGRGRLSELLITGRNDSPRFNIKKHIETFSMIGKQSRYSEDAEKPWADCLLGN